MYRKEDGLYRLAFRVANLRRSQAGRAAAAAAGAASTQRLQMRALILHGLSAACVRVSAVAPL